MRIKRSEALALLRRRAGITQVGMARVHGVTRHEYGLMELGQFPIPKDWDLRVGTITTQERCWLYRRRAGKLQREVAEELGVSRVWVNNMERGLAPVQDLVTYWEV